jgi:hypothetical protein
MVVPCLALPSDALTVVLAGALEKRSERARDAGISSSLLLECKADRKAAIHLHDGLSGP